MEPTLQLAGRAPAQFIAGFDDEHANQAALTRGFARNALRD